MTAIDKESGFVPPGYRVERERQGVWHTATVYYYGEKVEFIACGDRSEVDASIIRIIEAHEPAPAIDYEKRWHDAIASMRAEA